MTLRSRSGRKTTPKVKDGRVQRFGVEIIHDDGASFSLCWTPRKAKAWQLLHLFLYDLSVHDQFMRGWRKPRSEHDDAIAEDYASRTAARILPAYERALGPIL